MAARCHHSSSRHHHSSRQLLLLVASSMPPCCPRRRTTRGLSDGRAGTTILFLSTKNRCRYGLKWCKILLLSLAALMECTTERQNMHEKRRFGARSLLETSSKFRVGNSKFTRNFFEVSSKFPRSLLEVYSKFPRSLLEVSMLLLEVSNRQLEVSKPKR